MANYLLRPATLANYDQVLTMANYLLWPHLYKVPVANYAAVLPGSKLVFRGTDALRLDMVTIFSLALLLVQVGTVARLG